MRQQQYGGFVRTMGLTLLGLFVLALCGVVLYLLSDINHRRYRLAQSGQTLYVEQGRFFPIGFAPYTPEPLPLRQAYAPITVPAGENVEAGIPFDDRSEIDRALYARLSQWARQRLSAQDSPSLSMGIGYVKRLEALPGLSESQRQELRGMRADAAFRQGEGLLEGIALTLHHAASQFALALELGTTHADKARADLQIIDEKLRQLGETPDHDTNAKDATPPLFGTGRQPAP